ncbi:MAG: glycosyltransferase family 39 protein [Planctomycetes bacterium]|nr:glycosyltransferase family 39 protein [Planctomycetota bacterium]
MTTDLDDPARAARGLPDLGSRALFVVAFALCVVAVWSETSVTGQDEYWLSFRTPLEMLERDSYLTPWLNGEPRLQKPPLLYWLSCLSYAVLGPSPFAARLWGVLAGAGIAVVAARMYRRLFGADGTLAGLVAVTALGVSIESRRAMLDLPMGFLAMWSVLAGMAWASGGRRLGHALLAAALLGLAVLTKGPVAILFAGTAAVAGVLVASRQARSEPGAPRPPRRLGHALLALAVLALVVAPWPWLMALRWPRELDAVLHAEAEARHVAWFRPQSIGPVLGGSLGAIAPWSVAALFALWAAARGTRGGDRFLVAWCAVAVVPFLFIKTFERYLIPMVCPLAVLVARYLECATPRALRNHLTLAVAVLGAPVALAALFVLWFGLGVAGPLATLAAWSLALRTARRDGGARRVALWLGVTTALLLGAVYPSLGLNRLPADLPADLGRHRVAVYHRAQPAMLSIRLGRSVVPIEPGDDVGERLRGFRGYVFVQSEDAEDFRAEAARAGLLVTRAGTFRSFYSRKAWLRFARADATWADWRRAIVSRSLAPLQPGFEYDWVTDE